MNTEETIRRFHKRFESCNMIECDIALPEAFLRQALASARQDGIEEERSIGCGERHDLEMESAQADERQRLRKEVINFGTINFPSDKNNYLYQEDVLGLLNPTQP